MQLRNLATLLLLVPLVSSAQSARERDRIADAWKQTLPAPNADYGTYPADYEVVIKAYMETTLKDPESARYSDFSKPRKEHIITNVDAKEATYGYSACVLVNAKNSYGGYTGNHRYWFFLRDGKIIRNNDVDSGYFGKIIYQGRNVNCQDGDSPAA